LPAAEIPEKLIPYIVQQRFRKEQDGWPLIQIGPGVVTLNDTTGYVWNDFNERIASLIALLLDAYPKPDQLIFNNIMLRYIDSYVFDYRRNNTFEFLKEKMKTEINLYQALFKETKVRNLPLELDLKSSFESDDPKGSIELRFSNGRKNGENAIIWQIMFKSSGLNTPKIKENIMGWVEKAHLLTDDWFFKIIEGDLQKEFE